MDRRPVEMAIITVKPLGSGNFFRSRDGMGLLGHWSFVIGHWSFINAHLSFLLGGGWRAGFLVLKGGSSLDGRLAFSGWMIG
jgi:hypothetical protein